MSNLFSEYIDRNMKERGIDNAEFQKITKLPDAIIRALKEDRCVVDTYIANRIWLAFQVVKNIERTGKNED